jgi:hypothetical protein
VRSPDVLDELPDVGTDAAAVQIPRSLVEHFSGEQLAIPELRTQADVTILSRICFSIPALGDPAGWGVTFGRELNVTEDRQHFVDAGVKGSDAFHPVLEGKHIRPFTVDLPAARFRISARAAASLLDAGRTYARPRLAYRDVAAATNRLTLIAAIIPAGALTTHTLFCLKGYADEPVQQYLCGLFNSFVANYLVRLRVGTHVTVSIIERLPVPKLSRDSDRFRAIASLSRRLAANPADKTAAARLQAAAALAYGLTADEFRHVLATFPLVPTAERELAMEAFRVADSSLLIDDGRKEYDS